MENNQGKAAAPSSSVRRHNGSCHCGAVKYAVELYSSTSASMCNCSICTKVGAVAAIVKPSAFTLLAGADSLGEYQWGPKLSTRFFCKQCGVHSFARGHLEEVGGDYVSINCNTLDDIDLRDLKINHWDGRHNNWEAGTRSSRWPVAESVAG